MRKELIDKDEAEKELAANQDNNGNNTQGDGKKNDNLEIIKKQQLTEIKNLIDYLHMEEGEPHNQINVSFLSDSSKSTVKSPFAAWSH